MYVGCRHDGKDIPKLVSAAKAAAPESEREAIARMLKKQGFTSRDGTVINGETYGVIDAILSRRMGAEPVAWRYRITGTLIWKLCLAQPAKEQDDTLFELEPLYASPPAPALDARTVGAQLRIWFHGTDFAASQKISEVGFRAGSWFAERLEDAIEFGGEYVFEVALSYTPAKDGNWQMLIGDAIPPDAIVSLNQYKISELQNYPDRRKRVFVANQASPIRAD